MQGHSGGKHIDPTLQDNVLLQSDCAEHIYHVGGSHDTHSIIQSGLIPGGKDVKKGSMQFCSGPNGPMNLREEYQEAKRIVNDCRKNLAKLTTDFILESKFDRDQTNHLLGTTKVRSASIRRQAGSSATLSKHQVLLPQDGNRLRGESLLHGHRHQGGVSDRLFQIKVLCLQAMAIPTHASQFRVFLVSPLCLPRSRLHGVKLCSEVLDGEDESESVEPPNFLLLVNSKQSGQLTTQNFSSVSKGVATCHLVHGRTGKVGVRDQQKWSGANWRDAGNEQMDLMGIERSGGQDQWADGATLPGKHVDWRRRNNDRAHLQSGRKAFTVKKINDVQSDREGK